MGYETKIYICEDSKFKEDEFYIDNKTIKAKYAMVICSIDLCKYSELFHSELSKLDELPRHYIYGSDGNTAILKDSYNDILHTYKAGNFMEVLKKVEAKDKYRRYRIAIAALTNVLADFDNPIVITEGY